MADVNEGYLEINKAKWDERAPEHAKSPTYARQRFLLEPDYLSHCVVFDLPLLGDITDLEIVHLQCHIGTDTISLARRGARHVVGLDFSAPSLKEARDLSAHAVGGEKLSFVEATVYDALTVLHPGSFDLVFTGIGALCWLPSIRRWAETVAALLKPGGRLFIREGHPVMWAIDDKITHAPTVGLPYFEREEPDVYEDSGTYVETDKQVFETRKNAVWNHGIGEIVQALLDSGMAISSLIEHRSVPWNSLPGHLEKIEASGEWILKKDQDNLPLTYTLQALKKQ